MEREINELKNTAQKILAKYRQNLLNNHPFIGTIAMNLDLVPVRDARCSTAMTDGKSIFFDIDFLSKLNEKEGIFVLGHEVWHVVMMHFLRGENLDHNTFNIACDMEVNQLLESDGFIPPADVIFPNKNHVRNCEYNFPDKLSAEEYYNLLIELKEQKNEFNDKDQNAGNENGKNSKSKKNDEKNACNGQFDKHFDKHANYDEEGENALKKDIFDKYGKKGLDEDFTPGKFKSETNERALAEEIRQNIVSASQTYERLRGVLPDHVKKIVNNILDAKVSWKEALAKFITSGFDNKTNWNSPNRRFAYSGTYLPQHRGEMMKIAIGIDTSGSCESDCEKFLSEVNGIAKSFGNYEFHLIQCDTEVKDYQMFDEYNPIESQIEKIQFHGFGGTKLKPIFDYIEMNDIDVSGIVIFTDGMCEEFDDDGTIDTPIMWSIVGNYHCNNLKIGEKIYIE